MNLCVAFSAVGADVGLDMFGLLVLWVVLQQGGLIGEALVAGLTLVRLVSLVTSRVTLEIRQLREGLGAT